MIRDVHPGSGSATLANVINENNHFSPFFVLFLARTDGLDGLIFLIKEVIINIAPFPRDLIYYSSERLVYFIYKFYRIAICSLSGK
jgi:hypothetical protein